MIGIIPIYIVKKRIDFWKEDLEKRKYFLDLQVAENYQEELTATNILVPTIVIIEQGICIVDDVHEDNKQVYLLKSSIISIEDIVSIEFAYYRPIGI
jgi:hypothetical protein